MSEVLDLVSEHIRLTRELAAAVEKLSDSQKQIAIAVRILNDVVREQLNV